MYRRYDVMQMALCHSRTHNLRLVMKKASIGGQPTKHVTGTPQSCQGYQKQATSDKGS